jgi:3-hydroxy-3-methylglutaryl CoA synthase
MVGIVSYGAYVPIYRLSRDELVRVWGGGYRKGEKAIANCDEDSITMSVEAVLNCLNGVDRQSIDGLYFASMASPYRVKRAATIIAAAADLRQDIFTADFTNSFGAGASALRAAIDAVASGSAKKVIVVASDCQITPPNSNFESMYGDGAAALLIGNKDTAVTFEAKHSISSDFLDIWRKERGDPYVRTWEDRFVIDNGYMVYLRDAIVNLLKTTGLTVKDINKFAFYGPDPRSHANMARSLGLDKNQIQDPMFDTLGNTGVAFFMMILVAALEKAKEGEKILAASYGDGADVFLLKTTDQIKKVGSKKGIEHHLASKMILPNYGTYLRFRNLMEWERTPFPDPESSVTVMARDEKALIRGHGHKCKVCGHIQYPPQRVCMWCQSRDQFEEIRISDKKGKLFTFSLDERAVIALDLPNVLAIVDLDEGGRVYGQVTDRDPGKIKIGMPIELTFRKFHEGGGFHNYAWKCRPIR